MRGPANTPGTGSTSSDPVRAWLAAHTPIAPHLLEGPEFIATVRERRRAVGAADDGAYVRQLDRDPEEAIRIQTAIAVPESWLFRYRASFEWLRAHLVERREAGRSTLRMLCAPCARGQEAYSLAATALAAGYAPTDVTLEAIDLAEPHLDVARTGACAVGELREGMPEWAGASFVATSGTLSLEGSLLKRITFRRGDLLDDGLALGDRRFDVIACRNLLIYLSDPARQRLIGRLEGWLAPKGALLIGHADAVRALTDAFEPLHHAAFAWRCRTSVPQRGIEPRSWERASVASAPAVGARSAAGARAADGAGGAGSGAVVGHTRRPMKSAAPDGPASTQPPLRPSASSGSSGPAGPSASETDASDALAAAHAARDERAIRAAAERLLRIRPDATEAHLALAALLAPRDPKTAESHLRRALYVEPASEPALMALAALLDRDGRAREADRLRARAMRSHLDRVGPRDEADDRAPPKAS